jgi:hypothetical protein
LWTRDVAEVFLGTGDGSYVEWNLGPRGSWWAQGYRAYRDADSGFRRPEGVESWGRPWGPGWEGGLVFPWNHEADAVWRLNVTSILGTRTGATRWFALAAIPEAEPDFHRVDRFPEAREEIFRG